MTEIDPPQPSAKLLERTRLEAVERARQLLQSEQQTNRLRYCEFSVIWQEVAEVLRYVLQLGAEDILRLRMHSGLFVGEAPWQYWHIADQMDADAFASQLGYKSLIKDIPESLWASEARNSRIPRPMGVTFRNRAINGNVTRNQNVVTNLKLTGIWDAEFSGRDPGPAIVVEIGTGYGGLAEVILSSSARPVHYVAIDLPEILLFCCGYVAAAHPEIDIHVLRAPGELARIPQDRHALILISSFASDLIAELPRIDLALNMASFQEMRTQDIERYIALVYPKLKNKGLLYSDNIDHHKLNTQSPVPISRLFSRFGPVYPPPEAYDPILQTHKWDWFYSTYLLGTAPAIDALRKHIRVFFGPMKQGAVMDLRENEFSQVVV